MSRGPIFLKNWISLGLTFPVGRAAVLYLGYGALPWSLEAWTHVAAVPLLQATFDKCWRGWSMAQLRTFLQQALKSRVAVTLLGSDCLLLWLWYREVDGAALVGEGFGSQFLSAKAVLCGGWLLTWFWRHRKLSFEGMCHGVLGVFLVGFGLETFFHLLPFRVLYLFSTLVATITLIALLAFGELRTPQGLGRALSGPLLILAALIAILSFLHSPWLKPGWDAAAALLLLPGMSLLMISLVEGLSAGPEAVNRDFSGTRENGGEDPLPLWAGLFLRYWLFLFAVALITRYLISYLGFGRVDLRARVVSELLFVPVFQAMILLYLRGVISSVSGFSTCRGLLADRGALLSLCVDLSVLGIWMSGKAWTRMDGLEHGLFHYYTGLKGFWGAALMVVLAGRYRFCYPGSLWIWSFAAGLTAYSADYFTGWLGRLPSLLFPHTGLLVAWSLVYGCLLLLSFVVMLQTGRVMNRKKQTLGGFFNPVIVASFLAALFTVLNYYSIPFLVPPFLGIVKTLSFLVLSTVCVGLLRVLRILGSGE